MRQCSAGPHYHNQEAIVCSSSFLQVLTQWQVFTHRNWHHSSQPCTSCSTSSCRQEEVWREVLPTGKAVNGTFFSAKCKDSNKVSSICLPRINSSSSSTKCQALPALSSAVAEMSEVVGSAVAAPPRSPPTPLPTSATPTIAAPCNRN